MRFIVAVPFLHEPFSGGSDGVAAGGLADTLKAVDGLRPVGCIPEFWRERWISCVVSTAGRFKAVAISPLLSGVCGSFNDPIV